MLRDLKKFAPSTYSLAPERSEDAPWIAKIANPPPHQENVLVRPAELQAKLVTDVMQPAVQALSLFT